jgi:serine/threonine protein kinase
MKPYTGSTLSAALVTSRFSEKDIRRISFDILKGISSVHRHSYVHRDIRPETILLSERGKVRVGDFGTSALVCSGCRLSEPAGTRWYMAPELCDFPLEYDSSVDMWALGVVLFDMVSGRERPSWGNGCEIDVSEWHLYMTRELRDFGVSEELKDVITALLDLWPSRRPRATELLRHLFYVRERLARKGEAGSFSGCEEEEEKDDKDDNDKDKDDDDKEAEEDEDNDNEEDEDEDGDPTAS